LIFAFSKVLWWCSGRGGAQERREAFFWDRGGVATMTAFQEHQEHHWYNQKSGWSQYTISVYLRKDLLTQKEASLSDKGRQYLDVSVRY
jgi:hypothetical protein